MEPTHPDRLVENVTAPSAGGFPGWGGLPQGRRVWEGDAATSGSYQQLPWPVETEYLKFPNVGGRAWNYNPLAGRKRHRALCGRFPDRMGRTPQRAQGYWEGDAATSEQLSATAFSGLLKRYI